MILKSKDIRDKSTEELQEELAKLRKDLFDAKMSFHSRKLENHSSMREMKKSIARILTVLTERANGGEG
ncbi:MAG: 50S ribosomal protein L29 [Candidatus Melainabacteria bacterium]|nr:50S ribosomal protein L29 [Candidatus Melainabacteria bacterium]